MKYLLNYIIPILEFITLVIELVMVFRPSEPIITISTGDNFYFHSNSEATHRHSQVSNDFEIMFLLVVALMGSYLFYSLTQKYMIIIIMFLTLLKIVRYKTLGIGYNKEFVIPSFIAFMLYSLNFLPNNIKEFWKTNSKIDISQLKGLQTTLNTLQAPLNEIVDIFTNFNTNLDRNISIVGTIILVFIALYSQLKGILGAKKNIKISETRDIVTQILGLSIIYGFIFFSIEWNPIRKTVKAIIYYFHH